MTKYISLHKKHFNFKKFILAALKEDIGDGDHTALSTIPASHKGKMQLLVKEEGILAGVEAAVETFKIIDKNNSILCRRRKIFFRMRQKKRWKQSWKETQPMPR